MPSLPRFLICILFATALCASAQTVMDRLGVDEEALLRMPEVLIPGLAPLTKAALDAAPAMITARLQVLAAMASEDASRALTRPRADVYLNSAYRENNTTKQGGLQTYYNITAEQPLWHWNALDNQKRIATIQRQLAENDYDEARRSLVLDIRQRYLGLVEQKRSLTTAAGMLEQQRKHLAVSKTQAGRGEQPADALVGEQLDVSAAEVNYERQQAGFGRALRDFAVINGLGSFAADALPVEVPDVPAAALALFNAQPAAAVATDRVPAALARPAGTLESSRLNQEVIRVGNRPMLNLAAGADQNQTSGVDQTAVITYFLGITVNWNIFDGFATRANTRQARAVVRQNEKALQSARTALASQLADKAADVAFAVRDLQIAEGRFAQTQSSQKVDRELHASGRLSDADWQARQAVVQTTLTALYAQRGQLILQLAEYELLRQRATKPSKEIPFP